jgi:hypothetical protein
VPRPVAEAVTVVPRARSGATPRATPGTPPACVPAPVGARGGHGQAP